MSREAFEKWAKGRLDLQHIGVCYGDDVAEAAWQAWQAAQAQAGDGVNQQLPKPMKMYPFQTIDTGSKNYKAGWNACLAAIAAAQESPQVSVNQQLLEALKSCRSFLEALCLESSDAYQETLNAIAAAQGE